MKKITALLLAALMIFGMAACTKKEPTPSADNPKEPQQEAPQVLTVALSPDFAPMEFVDTTKKGQEQFVGFDVSLAKYIAEEFGMELQIKPMDFDACQVAVQTGNVDMSISGYSWTEKRAENYELSDYYYAGDNESKQTVIVLAENAGKWTSAEDYKGKKVGAQLASLQYDFVTSQLPDAECKTFKDIGTGVEALRNGNIDALAVAEGNGKAIIAGNDKIGMSGFFFEVDDASQNNLILIQKGNTELLAKVNEALAKAYENGYYGGWYTEAQELAGIDTSQEISYDENGEVAN